MELKLRGLLLFVAALVLFSLGASILVLKASPIPLPVPPLGPTLGTPPSSSLTAKPQAIAFHDESTAWNWENRCAEALARFVAEQGFTLSTLTITLVDEQTDLPLGVVYPDPVDPEAMVLTACAAEESGLVCKVAVAAAVPGHALNTAMAAALGYGVREHFRTKSEDVWQANRPWQWADFQPMIGPEDDEWQSLCLEVTAA